MNAIWQLPNGFDEALPDDAWRIEFLRRRLLDLFQGWGYDLVVPPLVEFVDSLLTGTGTDLELQTFRFTDQQTGRTLGLRADMTPQVARIDAHRIQRNEPLRLCYIGTVLRTHSDGLGSSRSPIQFGAELYGSDELGSDIEALSLMLGSLEAAEVDDIHLDLGHVALFRALVREATFDTADEAALFELLQAKARPELQHWLAERKITSKLVDMFSELAELHGDQGILSRARKTLAGTGMVVQRALDKLEALGDKLALRYPDLPVHYDLAELRGYHYHTGVVFSAYIPGHGQEIARGGRYDGIGKAFGRARPATGFSADLKTLLAYSPIHPQRPKAIWAPGSEDPTLEQTVDRLRADGHRVIRALSTNGPDTPLPECDRHLVFNNEQWRVQPLADHESATKRVNKWAKVSS